MPYGDGTGPSGGGSGTPRRGSGQAGRGMGRGGGRGRLGGNRPGAGPGGDCVCQKCGTRVPHQQGSPCSLIDCPTCGTKMMRG
jgi:hypothetical protein